MPFNFKPRYPYPADFSKFDKASLSIRKALGIERLSRQQINDVKAAVALHQERQQNRPAPIPASGRIAEELLKRTKRKVVPFVFRLYRTAASQWAGGETDVNLSLDAREYAEGHAVKAWSDNKKWSGNDAVISLTVSPRWMSEVYAIPGLAAAGGMLTTHATRLSESEWQASWVAQGRGFDINVQRGFIVRVGDEFYHGKSLEAAHRMAARASTFNERVSLRDTLHTLPATELVSRFGHIQIARRDSLRSGNCEAGTDNWISRNFPGRQEGTVAEVMGADPHNPAVRRAVIAALLRARVKA